MGSASAFAVGATTLALLRRVPKSAQKDEAPASAAAAGKGAAAAADAAAAGDADGRRRRSSPLAKALRLGAPGVLSAPTGYAVLLGAGIVARLGINIRMSREIGAMGALVTQRDWPRLFDRQLSFALWALPAALMNAFIDFAVTRLALSLRANMNAKLSGRYRRPVEVAAALKDPEQRATADAEALSSELAQVYVGFTRPTLEVLITSVQLGRMMGAAQLAQCYGFFVISAGWVRLVAPPVSSLATRAATCEGELRASHAHLTEHAEESHFLQGATPRVERRLALARFGAAAAEQRAVQNWRFWVDASAGYVVRYMGILAAFTAMMPAVRSGASGEPTEYFLTTLHLLVNVGLSMRDLVVAFKHVETARGLAVRVCQLSDMLEEDGDAAASAATRAPAPSDRIEVEDLAITVPGATAPLLQHVTFTVAPGQRLLVVGGNGVGKTSLLRVLRGIWRPAAGRVRMPPPEQCYFLPARAYLVPGLTLRQQLLFPRALPALESADAAAVEEMEEGAAAAAAAADVAGAERASRAAAASQPLPSDEDVAEVCTFAVAAATRCCVVRSRSVTLSLVVCTVACHRPRAASHSTRAQVLRFVGLESLLSAHPRGLDALDACASLSAGERQRLALAQLLLARPRFALLDESTANVPRDFERRLFARALRERLPDLALVTVSHNHELLRYHDACLDLRPHGEHTYRSSAEEAAAAPSPSAAGADAL